MNFSDVPWQKVAESPALFATRIGHVFLDSFSILLNLCTATAWLRSIERHLNQRVIFLNICLAAVLCNANHLAKTIYFFVNYLKPHGLVMSTRLCFLSEFVRSVVVRTTVFFVIGLSAERAIATKWHATYERRSGLLSIVWVSLCWGQSVATFVYTFEFTNESQYLPFCTSIMSMSSTTLLGTIAVYATIGVLSFIMYLYSWRIAHMLLRDFKTGRTVLSLSSRMQLQHNLDSTKTLLPTIVWHLILWATLQTYLVISEFAVQLPFADRIVHGAMVDFFEAIYFLVDAAILLCFSKSLRIRLVVLLPSSCQCSARLRRQVLLKKLNSLLSSEKAYDCDTKYFEALQHSWQTAANLSRKFGLTQPRQAMVVQDFSCGEERILPVRLTINDSEQQANSDEQYSVVINAQCSVSVSRESIRSAKGRVLTPVAAVIMRPQSSSRQSSSSSIAR